MTRPALSRRRFPTERPTIRPIECEPRARPRRPSRCRADIPAAVAAGPPVFGFGPDLVTTAMRYDPVFGNPVFPGAMGGNW